VWEVQRIAALDAEIDALQRQALALGAEPSTDVQSWVLLKVARLRRMQWPSGLWTLDTASGAVLVHKECAAFLPKPEPAEPSAIAYHATSAEPDGTSCEITVIELPQAQRYRC
jgi:hypothetical protein